MRCTGGRRCNCSRCTLRKFHGAVGRNDLMAVVTYLTGRPGILNRPMPGAGGKTAIFKAIECHRLDMVELLMTNGADMTARYGEFTPLEEAMAMSESLRCKPIKDDIAKFLIRHCDLVPPPVPAPSHHFVEYFTFSHWGGSLYHLICLPENTRCDWNYQALLDIIATRETMGHLVPDINAPNQSGISPLAMACYYNKPDAFLDLLVGAGADVWLSDVELSLLRDHSDWCCGETKIRQRQAKAQVKCASLIRSFGEPGEIYARKLPDEVWREIMEFIIIP
uniref:Uncharacterized protein n=1 Tax=viral metagenome TaxID=1070528 RepID=A0A6C0KDU0_9ZZZZ